MTLCDQQRSLDIVAALHTSFRNVPGFCSVMNSSLNYIFESVHPYDDVAVRFGTLLKRVTGGGGSDSSDPSDLYVIDPIDLYVVYNTKCDLQFEFIDHVIINKCQIKSRHLTDLPATGTIGMLLNQDKRL